MQTAHTGKRLSQFACVSDPDINSAARWRNAELPVYNVAACSRRHSAAAAARAI